MNTYIFLAVITIVFILAMTFIRSKTKLNIDIYLILTITISYSFFAFYQLGSFEMCNSYYQPVNPTEEIIFEFEDNNQYFNRIVTFTGEGDNTGKDNYQINYYYLDVYGSDDLNEFTYLTQLNSSAFLKYEDIYLESDYRYIKLVFNNLDSIMNEIGFYNNDQQLPVSIIDYNENQLFRPENMIDEQEKIPDDPTYYDESYFDEIYHVRNGLEIATGSRMYASVHPLLGTVMISLGIRLFGFVPFGFRFFGAFISVMMLPIIYLLLKKMFNKPFISAAGTILFAADFMHYTTGRIATLEPFSIFFILLMYFFMYRYYNIELNDKNSKSLYIYLYLTSLAMSLSWATKWTGLYATLAIIFMYFLKIFKEYNRENLKLIIRILLFSVVFFVIQPLLVYISVYGLTDFSGVPANNFLDLARNVYDYTLGIYDYHSNLDSSHPFQSTWYQWIFNIRPIWYYYHESNGIINTISCFNNPLVTIPGFFSMIYCVYDFIKNKSFNAMFIILGYLSAILPWVFVSRCVFSYHYYPSVPFLVLATAYVMNKLLISNAKYKKPLIIYIVSCIILFLLFLPVISGLPVSKEFVANVLHWLQSWVFYV